MPSLRRKWGLFESDIRRSLFEKVPWLAPQDAKRGAL